MTDTTTTDTPNEAPSEENLQGQGGTMSFDAASSLAQAFDKLKIGAEPATAEKSDGEPVKPEAVKPAVKPPTADALSALGGAPARVLRADEALPLLAVATGAKLICAGEGLHPADGIGAVLRYAEMSSAG